MLLSSGHTALFWNEDNLYADIEFLGDGRIAYFIKKNGDKHKGVLEFKSQKMPLCSRLSSSMNIHFSSDAMTIFNNCNLLNVS